MKKVRETPEKISVKEETAARSSRPIEREVLMKLVKEGSTKHAVKCSLTLDKRISKRKLLKQLYVNGSFTENRSAWEKELQRPCE